MYRRQTYIPFIILMMFHLCSCQSDKANIVANQEVAIDDFINSKYKDSTVVRNNGSNRIVLQAGDSTVFVEERDSVTLLYNAYVFNRGISEKDLFASDSVTVCVSDKYFISGLRNGLLGASVNEISLILFSSKYGFYDEAVGLVPSLSALAYMVGIVEIKKN